MRPVAIAACLAACVLAAGDDPQARRRTGRGRARRRDRSRSSGRRRVGAADRPTGRPRRGCGSRPSTSVRATRSCSRPRMAPCSSIRGLPRRTSPPSCDVVVVRALTAVVLTHPQRDHVGGAADVMRRLDVGGGDRPGSRRDRPRRTSAPPWPTPDGAVSASSSRGPERSFRLGRLRLDVVWPDDRGAPGADPNLRATVVLARYGATTTALLTADAESDVTLRLRCPRVDVLKVAHHGSADPGLPELLRRIRPRIAVISVGRGQRLRASHGQETLAALEAIARASRLSHRP